VATRVWREELKYPSKRSISHKIWIWRLSIYTRHLKWWSVL